MFLGSQRAAAIHIQGYVYATKLAQVLHQLAMLYRDRQQWTQAGTCFRRLLKAGNDRRLVRNGLDSHKVYLCIYI